MRERYRVREKILAYIGAAVLLLLISQPVCAQSGKIYTCNITRCYSHPVTGVIEDAGGEASYATGQGMVESAVGTTGMLEITDGGDYYLTIRMSMMDYTTGHSFLVQKVGDSDWMSTTVTQVASATDSNGTTTDFRILVPSESCVVRCSMNVTPMGRDVIFYFYPGSYTEGNTSGMTAGIVTETSAAGAQEKEADTESAADTKDTTQTTGNVADTTQTTGGSSTSSAGSTSGAESSSSGSFSSAGSASGAGAAGSTSSAGASAAGAGSTSLGSTAQSAGSVSGTGTSGSTSLGGTSVAGTGDTSQAAGSSTPETKNSDGSVKGLSLSTESSKKESKDTGEESSNMAEAGIGKIAVALTLSMTISGLILIAAGAAVVYLFRKNWKKWGGEEDED